MQNTQGGNVKRQDYWKGMKTGDKELEEEGFRVKGIREMGEKKSKSGEGRV